MAGSGALSFFLVVLACTAAFASHIKRKDAQGQISAYYGDLGALSAPFDHAAALEFLHEQKCCAAYGLTGAEEFIPRGIPRISMDKIKTYSFTQTLDGIPVLGASLNVHVTLPEHKVHAITGQVARSKPFSELASNIDIKDLMNVAAEIGLKEVDVESSEEITLSYLIDENDVLRLVYILRVSAIRQEDYIPQMSSNIPEPIDVYVDALTGKYVRAISRHTSAGYATRNAFDTKNSKDLPGTLERSSDGNGEVDPPVSDSTLNQAFDNSGNCYDFYYTTFKRDSYDDEGGELDSTVHYSVEYNNAFWNGKQMVYGDGDGVIFSDFAADHTVVCHELSHAVTEKSSGLIYWSEAGALNEGFSDIMGSSSQQYLEDASADSVRDGGWVIGPNCTLIPINPNCATCPNGLRYMDNPTLDGSSRDYYPDRYTGFADNRGVHWNSGIANLAYVLTVQGGTHPRGVTTNYVEAIGLQKAQRVYYTGFTSYLHSNAKFEDALDATTQAAELLYGKSECQSVESAWNAVGVYSNTSVCV